jgi:multiple sugar transport system ATP-binding protein
MARVQVKGGLGVGLDGAVRDLDIADGELFAVAGADFDGRALLRRIAGLDTSSLEIVFNDKVVSKQAPESRNVSLVFSSGALFEHLSVKDNLAFGPRARGASSAETQERVTEAAAAMLIEPLLSKPITKLSAEDRARVALARGFTRRPAILLLEDPFVGLDSSTRRTLRQDFARAQRKLKVTTLLATRDPAEAFALANRVALFERGLVRQVGMPVELYEHPADRYVAARVGAVPMNLLRLKVENGRVGIGGMSLGVPEGASAVVLGIRPEEVFPLATSNATLPLRATVELCEFEGANARVVLLVNEQRVVMVCATPLAPSEGSDVVVYTDLAKLRLFSAEDSGVALDFEVVDSARIVPGLSKMLLDPNEIAALLEPREETPVISGVEVTPTPAPPLLEKREDTPVIEGVELTAPPREQATPREAFAPSEPQPAAEATILTPPTVTEQSDSSSSALAAQGLEAPSKPGSPDEHGKTFAQPGSPSSTEAA